MPVWVQTGRNLLQTGKIASRSEEVVMNGTAEVVMAGERSGVLVGGGRSTHAGGAAGDPGEVLKL
jgi:hypothetical protein